jgi:hypothetical protein
VPVALLCRRFIGKGRQQFQRWSILLLVHLLCITAMAWLLCRRSDGKALKGPAAVPGASSCLTKTVTAVSCLLCRRSDGKALKGKEDAEESYQVRQQQQQQQGW